MKNTNKNFSIFFVRGDPVKTLFNNFHKGPPYVKIFEKFLFVFFIRILFKIDFKVKTNKV